MANVGYSVSGTMVFNAPAQVVYLDKSKWQMNTQLVTSNLFGSNTTTLGDHAVINVTMGDLA